MTSLGVYLLSVPEPPSPGSRAPAATPNSCRPFDLVVIVVLPAICGFMGAAAGRDLNWDQLNYHLYVAHAFLHDRLAIDFNAASVQSYINPIAHLPFYWVAISDLGSWAGAFLLGALQGTAFSLLYVAARLATTIAPSPFGIAASLGVVCIGLSHPILNAELGSSFIEVNASIPLTIAVCLIYGADRVIQSSTKLALIAAAFALAGASVALKLAFAVFVPGLLLVPLLLVPTWQARVLGWIGAIAGLLLGWYVAGGFWHFRLWQEFGNPFFPFFNNIFRSPDFPTAPLANDRFLQHGADLLTLPWRMLSTERFVSTERVVVDPRYALLSCLAIAAIWRGWRQRASCAFEAPTTAWLLWVFVAWYFTWALVSGNGRYAVPMHLVSGLVIAQLSMVIWRNRRDALVVIWTAAAACLWCADAFGNLAHWTRAAHGARWYEIDVPEEARVPDGLYLTVGYFDRSSKSFIVPWFPQSARFVNVNGYWNPDPDGPGGERISQLINNHAGPLRIVTEGSLDRYRTNPPAGQAWLEGINDNLEGYGVRLAQPTKCVPLRLKFGAAQADHDPWVVFASVCPLERTTLVDHRRDKGDLDAAFNRLEMAFSKQLYPAHETSYFRGTGYCRFYSPLEYYACGYKTGFVTVFRTDPSEVLTGQKITTTPVGQPPKHP